MKKRHLVLGGILFSLVALTSINAETPNVPTNTLESKFEVIETMVENGELDSATAEEIKTELENCDGSGSKKLGQKYNLQFGKKLGNGQGQRHNQN